MDSRGLLPFLCIFCNNYTKAAVPWQNQFSKHRSTSSSKLFMNRWQFNCQGKCLEKAFYFQFLYMLTQFCCCFWYDLCIPFVSDIVPPTSSLKANKIVYLSCKLLVLLNGQKYCNNMADVITIQCSFMVKLPQDQPDRSFYIF